MSANNRIVWSGLAELKAALRDMPKQLHGEASHIVLGHANRAALDVRQAYHIGATGDLVQGVIVEPMARSEFYAGARVKSTDWKAWIYEKGSQGKVRHTRRGDRGIAPSHPIFPGAMVRERAAMYDDLRDLLRRNGLTVTG